MNINIKALRERQPEYREYPGITTNPPFSKGFTDKPLPRRFKVPHLEVYDGTLNLMDYLNRFKALIILQGVIEIILYRAFLVSLMKAGHLWLSSL